MMAGIRTFIPSILYKSKNVRGAKELGYLRYRTCTYTTTASPIRLVAGAIIARTPIIMPEPHLFEKSYDQYQTERLFEENKSLVEELNARKGAKIDAMKEAEEILEQLDIGGRTTLADTMKDVRSLERQLDQFLYLIVKKTTKKHAWQLPQGEHQDPEALHQTIQRELNETCGKNLEVFLPSRSPCAYMEWISDNSLPTQVFFYRGLYVDGHVELNKKEAVDHAWVTKDELSTYLSKDSYHAIQDVLFN